MLSFESHFFFPPQCSMGEIHLLEWICVVDLWLIQSY